MTKLIDREFKVPNKSFLLFGPRGVGKSTLIGQRLKTALLINLLKSSEFITLSQNPSQLHERVRHLKAGDWVFIDEVQRIPEILNEIHALYEEKKLNFALTGSSARKLKRGGANLLAGRALQNYLFPLIYSEYGDQARLKDVTDWGCLPSVITDPKNRTETLSTYVETYLRQELMEEGIIRKLDPFVRFLKVAGQYNGQILNVENIARESHIGRTTVDTYFSILEETLIGFQLPALQLGAQKKEITHPKFYFFDSGVARACSGLIFDEVDNIWRGFAFETYVLHEIRAYNHYQKKNRDLFYYKVSGGSEIDLLIETKKKTISKPQELIAIEIKYSKKWDKRWSHNISLIQQKTKKIKKTFAIYLGDQILTINGVTTYPIEIFLKKLYSGEIF